MRIMPRVGGAALVERLPNATPATITAVADREVEVVTDTGETLRFALHVKTGQFVAVGEPSYGTRLRLLGEQRD